MRKHRLDDALLFGLNPQERTYATTTARLMYSLLIAALVAAICVGYSFVNNLLQDQAARRPQNPPSSITMPWEPDQP